MNLLTLWMNQAYALSYVPLTGPNIQHVELPSFPELVHIEGLLFFILFVLLVKPLLKQRKDDNLEKERIQILKLSAIVGALAMILRFYRLLSGHSI